MTGHLKTIKRSRSMTSSFAVKNPLYWLALGAFAIGTEGFMIAPLLPGIAGDVAVSVATAGQLVTAFALAYALSSPILTALTGNFDRRRLLILSMAGFAMANVVAFAATGYWTLMAARILLAFAAGLYMPNANALAGALVAPERRGRALAIVNGGTTIAIALGVPLGALVGDRLGWRMTFAGVAILAAIATVGLIAGLRPGIGAGSAIASLRERIAVARQPVVLAALLVTTLWATGAYTVYTYLATYLAAATGIAGAGTGLVLFMWGIAAAVGLFIGGALNDKLGPRSVIVPSLVLLALAFVSLAASARLLSQGAALVPVLVAVATWGLAAWGFFPAQQARLIGIAGLKAAPVVLSLNASFMFVGFSAGAALGAVTLAHGTAADLGWVGAACEAAAALLVLATRRRSVVSAASTAA
jgi:predicted MFS family arabinose efflux permease